MTLHELVDQCIEFGMDIDTAESIAPALLPAFNDPRGLARTIEEDSPWLAAKLGLISKH
mgnify:CR=1 FL=1